MFNAFAANCNASAIGIFLFGAKHVHDLGLCGFFLAIYGDVIVVDDVEGGSSFGTLGFFWGDGTDALAEASEFICIVHVPSWS